MCGIAGIIYRDGTEHPIGDEMTRMLQAMKHRGPDSTGYALYGNPANGNLVMRYKLADANTPRDFEFEDRLRRHRFEVEARLGALGARIHEVEEETPYAFRVSFDFDGELKLLECNPRFWGSLHQAEIAGVPFPALLVRLARGSPPVDRDSNRISARDERQAARERRPCLAPPVRVKRQPDDEGDQYGVDKGDR